MKKDAIPTKPRRVTVYQIAGNSKGFLQSSRDVATLDHRGERLYYRYPKTSFDSVNGSIAWLEWHILDDAKFMCVWLNSLYVWLDGAWKVIDPSVILRDSFQYSYIANEGEAPENRITIAQFVPIFPADVLDESDMPKNPMEQASTNGRVYVIRTAQTWETD
jgi:hypothetical protein